MNMTPYEVRLELVKLAKEMLSEDFHTKTSIIQNKWQNEVAISNNRNENPPPLPKMPEYFTEYDVVQKALRLNDFISNGK
jgi:hypothetical protein